MNNEPVELSFFSDAIIRRWYLPVGFALVAALIGLQLRPAPGPTLYEAVSKVLIRPVTDGVFDSNLRVDQIINSDTEAQLASSELVARSTLELLGDEAPSNLGVEDIAAGLEVVVRTDSQIVVIRYQHADPDIAGAISDAVASAYLTTRSETATEEKARQANQLATQISDLTRDLTTANMTIAAAKAEADERESFERRIERLEEVVAIQALEGEESEIVGDPIGALQNELEALETTVAPAELAAANTTVDLVRGQIANLRDELIKLLTLEIDGGSVIQRAGVGDEVLPANRMIEPAIGAIVGLMIGIAAAVTIERAVRSRAASQRTTAPAQATHGPTPAHVPAYVPWPTSDPSWTPEPAHVGAPVPPPAAVTPTGLPDRAVSNGVSPISATAPSGRAPIEGSAVQRSPASHKTPSVAQPTSNGHAAGPVAQANANVDLAQPLPDPATWGKHPQAPVPVGPKPVKPVAAPPAPDVPATPAPAEPRAVIAAGPNTVAAIADIAKIPRSVSEPVVVTAPDSEPAIGLRTVARLIQNETAGIDAPSIMITSAKAHEGRTTVATNVAAALRQDGLKVLLVTDAYDRVIAPDVHVLPPGMHLGPDLTFPDNDRFRQLLDEARDLLDIVIIDGPPALTDGEAKRLAKLVDGAVIVAVSGRTSAADVAATKNWLEEAGTRILGLVTTTRPSWLVRRIGDRTVDKGSV